MTEAYFDRVATQWDTMRMQFFDERVRDAAILASGLRRGERALDIGAGTGFVTQGLLAARARAVAVDESEAMVAELRKKFGDSIEAHQGDGQRLPLPNSSIDAAFANMYLHHVEDPARAIAEATRVLRPGGRLVITDLDHHNHEFLRQEHHDRWMGFRREDVVRWFEAAGLREVQVSSTAECCCATSSCGTESAKVSIFLAVGTR